MIHRLVVAILVLVLPVLAPSIASSAQFGPSQYAILDQDGDPIANFDLSPQLTEQMTKLQGQVAVGDLKGDVTLLQFYDLNCPFCREAAADVDALVRADKKVKLVFVLYPVLSVQSVQGGRVELAAATMMKPDEFLELHRKIYAGRGIIDANKVYEAAVALGLDARRLADQANAEGTLGLLKKNADFGTAAKLIATPAYVINGVAILGHPGLKSLQKVIAAVRACGKVVC